MGDSGGAKPEIGGGGGGVQWHGVVEQAGGVNGAGAGDRPTSHRGGQIVNRADRKTGIGGAGALDEEIGSRNAGLSDDRGGDWKVSGGGGGQRAGSEVHGQACRGGPGGYGREFKGVAARAAIGGGAGSQPGAVIELPEGPGGDGGGGRLRG